MPSIEMYFKQFLADQLDTYEKHGYKIRQENDILIILYKNRAHSIRVVNRCGIAYWHIEPYNGSYFSTRFDGQGSFDIVLCAIRDADEWRTV